MTVSGTLFVTHSSSKSTLIFDLRPRNRLEKPPLPARLPTLQDIVRTLRTAPALPLYFTKLDIHRYFDSLLIPRGSCYPFYFTYHNTTYEYDRLPFGWANAPYTAQKFAEQTIRMTLHNHRSPHWVRVFAYLDDWLIASTSRSTCSCICKLLINSIQELGLIVNEKKSITRPTSEIAALGATICARDKLFIRPIDTELFSSITNLLSRPLTTNQLYRIAGSLLWRDRKILPFLTPIYTRAYHRIHGHLSVAEKNLLCAAASIAARGVLHPGLWEVLPSPTDITIEQARIIFCDASASRGLAALVLPDRTYQRFAIPHYVYRNTIEKHRRQQDAELYALYRTIRYALHTAPSTPTIIVSDSSSALWATYKLSAGITSPSRAHILRHVSRLLHSHIHHHIRLAYIRTQCHPADPLTFRHYSLQAVRDRLRTVRLVHPPPGRPPRSSICNSSIIKGFSGRSFTRVRFDPTTTDVT